MDPAMRFGSEQAATSHEPVYCCAVGGGVVTEVNHESVTEDGLELGTEVRREDADELESVDECFL